MSASGNPGADSFCFLTTNKPQVTSVAFSISCKHVHVPTQTRSKNDYLHEYEKATVCSNDLFIEYSTGKYPSFTSDDLPNDRCALVYEDNFKQYFGPFSGRAFILKNFTLPNINTAAINLLYSVDGIGETTINGIIIERTKRRFR